MCTKAEVLKRLNSCLILSIYNILYVLDTVQGTRDAKTSETLSLPLRFQCDGAIVIVKTDLYLRRCCGNTEEDRPVFSAKVMPDLNLEGQV